MIRAAIHTELPIRYPIRRHQTETLCTEIGEAISTTRMLLQASRRITFCYVWFRRSKYFPSSLVGSVGWSRWNSNEL